MRILAYSSKLYAFGLCLFSIILASGVYFIADASRKWLSLPFTCIAVLMIVLSLWGLIYRKPILTADESGLHDTRIMKTPILWSDIMAFRHVPRVETRKGRDDLFAI